MKKCKDQLTFVEMFQATKRIMTPSQKFIYDIAQATGAAEATVRMWVCGAQVPAAPSRKLIAQHLGVSVNTLFPDCNS